MTINNQFQSGGETITIAFAARVNQVGRLQDLKFWLGTFHHHRMTIRPTVAPELGPHPPLEAPPPYLVGPKEPSSLPLTARRLLSEAEEVAQYDATFAVDDVSFINKKARTNDTAVDDGSFINKNVETVSVAEHEHEAYDTAVDNGSFIDENVDTVSEAEHEHEALGDQRPRHPKPRYGIGPYGYKPNAGNATSIPISAKMCVGILVARFTGLLLVS